MRERACARDSFGLIPSAMSFPGQFAALMRRDGRMKAI
jgi:hypothetical protein